MLVAQACSFSNAPFFPPYAVDIDVVDPLAVTADKGLRRVFNRGSIELINTVGSCTVQLKLGQCNNGEEVWVNLRALPNDPACRSRCTCSPSVWARLQAAEGRSLALAESDQFTRTGSGVYAEVMAGAMLDVDGNGVVDKHSDENRIATAPLTVGKVQVHRATDAPDSSTAWPPFGEFYADLEASFPGVGYVRGRVDAAVEATDGTPVGPRCNWEVEQLQEDN